MKALCDKLVAQKCQKHGHPYVFLCIERDCKHPNRMMCHQCQNLKNVNGLINIMSAFEFLQTYQVQEVAEIKKCQVVLQEQFTKSKGEIIELLNKLESLEKMFINSLQGNHIIQQIEQNFVNCEINKAMIQNISQLLDGQLEINNEGEYTFTKENNLHDQFGYILSKEINEVYTQSIGLLSSKLKLIEDNINQDNICKIKQNLQLEIVDGHFTKYQTVQQLKIDDWCRWLCFNHNDTQIAAAVDNSIVIYNLSAGQEWIKVEQVLNGHTFDVWKIKFNHTSTQIASCGFDKLIIIWKKIQNNGTDQWIIQSKLNQHTGSVRSICFNHNSTILASGSEDKAIHIYVLNKDDWQLKQQLVVHTGFVYDVCFNHTSTLLASASQDNSIILWECNSVGNWTVKQKLTDHTSNIYSVTFNSASLMVSGSEDKSIKIWSSDKDSNWKCNHTLTGHTDSVYRVHFSKQYQMILSSSDDKTIKTWEINEIGNWICTQTINQHKQFVRNAILTSDSQMMISGSQQTILIHKQQNSSQVCWNIKL